jgi:outer membrane protein OmpA-like peptidoglycan-associated protein
MHQIAKNFLTLIAIALVVSIFLSGAFATEIRYSDYNFSQDLVQMSKSDMFVLCDNCPKTKLTPYKEKPLTIAINEVKEPVISVRVVESAKPVVEKNLMPEQKPTLEPVRVFFDFNKWTLKSNEKEKLLNWVKKVPGAEVEVYGYACPIGAEDYNKILSAKRAGTVMELLKEHGSIVLKAEGKGKTTQFGKERDEYWRDRTVEIVPTKKDKSVPVHLNRHSSENK